MIVKATKMLPGIFLCLLIAAVAWHLGKLFPVVGGPVFGILIGMIITLLFPAFIPGERYYKSPHSTKTSYKFGDGVKYTSKKLLQYSIILLGFEMNLFHIIKVGGQSLFIILFTMSASFLIAYFVGKALHLPGKMTTLIGVGTSICGGSAIAATAPVIQARDEDVVHAISTIFLFNIIAVFIFPALGHLFHMSDIGFGMWAGTAINDTSSVVAAGTSWSAVVGDNTALAYATIVKLTRTLMIIPITLVLAIYTASKNKQTVVKNNFRFFKIFPWFVIGFIVAAICNTFVGIPTTISGALVSIGKFVIIMAMSAIGLSTQAGSLIKNGFKPIVLGVCCWFAVASVSLLVQGIMNTW